MIHIAVCDDEKEYCEKIAAMASGFFRRNNLEAETVLFSGGEELLQYGGAIDILFLDIQMRDINGMAAARQLRSRGFRGFLIFITVLPEMVFDAFAVEACDYLVKPVEETHLWRTMERLLVTLRNTGQNSLLVQRGYESHIVPLSDIVFCEIIDRKIYLHLTSMEVIDFYEKIENLEARLDGRFFRCHRSFLINLQYLKSFKDGLARMEGGVQIPVSRLRSREFSEAVLRYMKSI